MLATWAMASSAVHALPTRGVSAARATAVPRTRPLLLFLEVRPSACATLVSLAMAPSTPPRPAHSAQLVLTVLAATPISLLHAQQMPPPWQALLPWGNATVPPAIKVPTALPVPGAHPTTTALVASCHSVQPIASRHRALTGYWTASAMLASTLLTASPLQGTALCVPSTPTALPPV